MLNRELRQKIKDWHFVLLMLAFLCMLVVLAGPQIKRSCPVYNYTFIIDITRSMNARDYQLDGQAVSRLQYVKHQLRQLLITLPCQSKIGLGVFTDRHSTLLFEPLELCSSRAEIDRVIEEIDWRMAWAADSRISKALYKTMEMLQNRPTRIVFLTDGQEAPPINPRYRTDFNDLKDKVAGIIVGVGGLNNVPIPKYDSRGQQIGFYTVDDVPHRSTFGIPGRMPTNAGNFHARNAPFGGARVKGDQHMSRLYEDYLQQLSRETGWAYHRLETFQQFNQALQNREFAKTQIIADDARKYPAFIALLLLAWIYQPFSIKSIKRSRR